MNVKINKFYFMLLLLVTVVTATFSQNYLKSYQTVENELKNSLNALFQDLDKSKITSGLLSNYALELTALAPYNGVMSDTNKVTMPVLLNLYSSIYSAKINNKISLSSPETVSGKIKGNAVSNNVAPLAMLHYEYDCLNDSAVKKGWLTYSGNRLRDVAGKPSPYMKKQLFAVAPQKMIFENRTVSFVFKSDLFYRNNSKSISGLYVNFNGSGWRQTSLNTAISYTFASGGAKNIQFKIRYSDGSEYFSHTNIYVKQKYTQLRAESGALYTNKTDSIKANSAHSGGVMEMHLQDTVLGLCRPLIIAAPFDMSAMLEVATAYSLDYIISQAPDIKAFIDEMKYDVVFVKYNNGLDDIFRNAELFKEAISRVNKNKVTNAAPNVVLGISMGGLVARYALSSMEKSGKNHDTWKYISMDAPHKGANIPLGLQAMVRHIESIVQAYGSGNNEMMKQLFGVLNSKAAKQMLIYHCAAGGSVDNSVHNDFQMQYDAIGFPQRCQNIAVSNGDLLGKTIFNPSVEIFNYHTDKISEVMDLADVKTWQQILIECGLFIADILTLGGHSFNIEFSVHALPDKSVSNIYNGYAYLKKEFLFGIFSKTFYLTQKSLNSEDYMLPLDGAAGSFNEFKVSETETDAKVNKLLENFIKKEFTFVPTFSSLALSNWDKMINKNLTGLDLHADGLTGFEYVYITKDNKKHPDFLHSASFIAKHLASPPLAFDMENSTFNLSFPVSLKNPQKMSVNWSVSNSYMGIINPNKTSATITCSKSEQKGILKVSTSISVSESVASALKLNSRVLPVEARRLITAKSAEMNIYCDSREFANGVATSKFNVSNWSPGIPIKWEVDTTKFKIQSSSGNSAIVEAVSYDKTATLTATATLADSKITASKSITGSKLFFFTSDGQCFEKVPPFNCNELEVSIAPVLSNIESVSWSLSNTTYAQIVSGGNSPNVRIKSWSNTGKKDLTLKAQVKTKRESYTHQMPASVVIPENLELSISHIRTFEENGKKLTSLLMYAAATPNNDRNCTYKWRTTKGTITPYVDPNKNEISITDFNNLATMSTTGILINSQSLSHSVQQTLSAAAGEDVSCGNVTVSHVASTQNAASNMTESIVLGISKSPSATPTESQASDVYVLFQNPNITPYEQFPEQEMFWLPQEYNPAYAILVYDGGEVTVSCDFISPCNRVLKASVSMVGAAFKCSYTSDSNSITIINDTPDNSGSGSGSSGGGTNTGTGTAPGTVPAGNGNGYYDPATGTWIHIYDVYVYDSYGLVKKTTMKSNESRLSIPMNGYPNGFYYINIVDSQGNVVTRQTVSVQ
jgi:hypothetical protein